MSNVEKIRELNDTLRTKAIGGKIVFTSGVIAQGETIMREILTLVKNYTDFTEDNNPYGEHDFGVIHNNGTKYFWKIDYYDLNYRYHSPDASDPSVTNRVLTVLLASEY